MEKQSTAHEKHSHSEGDDDVDEIGKIKTRNQKRTERIGNKSALEKLSNIVVENIFLSKMKGWNIVCKENSTCVACI